jgi:hypothetical protein
MASVGAMLFSLFVAYEARVSTRPIFPIRCLKQGEVLSACLVLFLGGVSNYLVGPTVQDQ